MSGELYFDGVSLSLEEGHGRRVKADRRCLQGPGVKGALAHVCALADEEARVPYDDPVVQGVRQDVLAWWIPMLGSSLVCLTTLALDESHCAGAITVVREDRHLREDPFLRLFPGTVVRTDLFSEVLPPPGPVLERYKGAPWPGGSF